MEQVLLTDENVFPDEAVFRDVLGAARRLMDDTNAHLLLSFVCLILMGMAESLIFNLIRGGIE